ncbi:MAG TPA: hypothetical protein VIN10_08340 [Bacteroidales bacterium]
MIKHQENMDELLREKLENFTPTPPEHIWTGIEKGLNRKPLLVLFLNNWKTISAIALVLLLFTFGAWYFLPNETLVAEEKETIQEVPELVISEKDDTSVELPELVEEVEVLTEMQDKQSGSLEISSENKSAGKFISEKNNIKPISETASAETSQAKSSSSPTPKPVSEISDYTVISGFNAMPVANIGFALPLDLSMRQKESVKIIPEKKTKTSTKGSWELGFYFSPEIIFKDFDSVRMLTSYSFNFEPTYYINNHWFLRFGLGVSSMRDRGFANLDYISNELMGTYDDVYDVTFDSVNGKLVPTYYTEKTEVWDSIRRLTVTEATNQYLYLQTPLLFGYYKKSSHFNWYVYGGPAINFLVYEQTEMSVDNADEITIIDLENRLPDRSPYFFQLWIGTGIEYNASKHISLAIEPNYRYYFSGVYDSSPYKTGFSGFALRLGIIYKIF